MSPCMTRNDTWKSHVDFLHCFKVALTLTFVAFVRPLVSGTGHFEEATVADLAADSHAPPIRVPVSQVADVEIVVIVRLVLLELFKSAICV